ncbi:MAG: penicillin-binding protein 2 [Rhodobacteraceae bacterium]|nr:penicillin-binding protein 2 [Paracoccaceae bacterium]
MRRSPRDSAESARKIGRRGLLLGAVQAGAVAVLALRMRSMQLAHADEYRLLSEGNSIKIRLLPPARGLIHDRNGYLLAGNESNYRVTITRQDAGDVAEVLARLRRLIALSDAEADTILAEIRRRSPITPFTIAERISWEEFSRIAVNAPALPGVTPEVGLSRVYPRGGDLAHVLGYVGPVSDFDLGRIEDPDPLLRIPRFQIGKVGIEAKMEQALRGQAGSRRVEVNSAGREMRELSRQEGDPGDALQLTIDYRLQNYVQARLGEESASAVIIDVTNGDVMAIASAPTFDPNLFVRGISSATYRGLNENDHRPLADKTVQGLYPPGSTYKMVTALAALEAGVIDPKETIRCPGYVEVGGRKFHCWRPAGHGNMNLQQSLEQSCDVYYYDLSQRVGIDKISDMARRLGLGQRHDLPMSAVAEGLAPTQAWKKRRYGRDWVIGDTLNATIGQGYVLTSPLQLAVMTARIASGRAVEPRLIRSRNGVEVPAPPAPALEIDPAFLVAIRAGMDAVVNAPRGTANGSRVVAAEMRMAGKTGTSQVRNISAAEREGGVTANDDLPWRQRDHALFVAFAPVEAPKYAVALVVEHGGGGSAVAAPLARDMLLFALYGKLPPLSAYPESQRTRIQNQRDQMILVDPDEAPPTASTRA